MRATTKHPGAGTFAEDARREAAAKFAASNLERGYGVLCLTGDHLGGEACVDTINRLALLKVSYNPYDRNTSLAAAKNLRNGVGVNSVAGSHSGGNTCAQVIAAVDDTY
jgi:hypothetical protein